MKHCWLLLMLVCALAYGTVSVTDVTAVPRWPWNGLVDITYSVQCDELDDNQQPVDVYLSFSGTDIDQNHGFLLAALTGDGADGPVKTGGPYKVVWDSAVDQPALKTSALRVSILATVGIAPYLVIDLSGGTDASSYPWRYSCKGPDVSQDVCRTTELWLRHIPAGTFTMGSPEGEFGRYDSEVQHEVTLTQPYYIGVFECTQRQWELVMGTRPSHFSNEEHYATRPVEQVSYDMLRGTGGTTGAGWPAFEHTVDADSFMGRLQARTGLVLDLPTEAQWEYACRKRADGSFWGTALNSGKNPTTRKTVCPNVAEVARYWYNGGSNRSSDYQGASYDVSASYDADGGTAKVGCYKPSELGLYDMHGNVWEWCLDWYDNYNGDATDPLGASSGTTRVLRGGSYLWHWSPIDVRAATREIMQSAQKGGRTPLYEGIDIGFRLACLPSCDITHSLSYTLTPSTATWTVNGQTYVSGDTVTLKSDFYDVTFSSVEGYDTPVVQHLSLVESMSRNIAYEPEGTAKPYLVIDLSAGSEATSYPYRYSATGPDVSQDACRTTELWLRQITAGTFTMGSPEEELGRSDDENQHHVTLTEDYYIGVFEFTQKQWELVMGTKPAFLKGDCRPVDYRSYNMLRGTGSNAGAGWPACGHTVDADSFLGKLQARTGLVFDLPTEAQWEYACRKRADGSCWSTALNSGKNLTSIESCPNLAEVGRYYCNTSDGKGGYSEHTKVGSYQPSELGLYDMHGNVCEWCLDWYGSYDETAVDPTGASSDSRRVLRGGSCIFTGANRCRAASRFQKNPPTFSGRISGFRLVCLPSCDITHSLSYTLTPSTATWNVDGKTYASGEAAVLTKGTYQVTFTDVDGYQAPDVQEVVLSENTTNTVTYTQLFSLAYTLTPITATWSVNGQTYDSGEAVWLPAGTYQVTFSDVDGYQTPDVQEVALSENTTNTVSYTLLFSLTYTLTPSSATWSVRGKTYASGEAVSLPAGTYHVTFSDFENYLTPETEEVVLSENTAKSKDYERKTYSLTYTLIPNTATWTVDGKTYASGDTVTLKSDFYDVTFSCVEGYDTPVVQHLSLVESMSRNVAYEAEGTAKPYLVIELSGGADAENYPWRYSATGPDVTQDACRTTELWLRQIPAGTFTMGSPEGELGRHESEVQHQVTLTQPFYIGVFECTQRQWELVMGTIPSLCKGDCRPVDGVSYNDIRGSGAKAGAGWPTYGHTVDADSFMGILQMKTGLVLDLPTRAQWEYACRKRSDGSFWGTALNSGKNLTSASSCSNMAEVGRYTYNSRYGNAYDGKGGYSEHTKVGSYQPSEQELYDMHGNVWEWCLDWYGSCNVNATDPPGGTSGLGRTLCGGGMSNDASSCRAAAAAGSAPSNIGNFGDGFRLAYLPSCDITYSLSYTMKPSTATWSVNGTTYSSGEAASLPAGTYHVTFSDLENYITPEAEEVVLSENTAKNKDYERKTYSLTYTLTPTTATWTVDGKTYASGEVACLPADTYQVTFSDLENYVTPEAEEVVLAANATKSKSYEAGYALSYTLTPDTATWSVNGKTYASGDKVTLKPDFYDVTFSGVEGYDTPVVQHLSLVEAVSRTVVYETEGTAKPYLVIDLSAGANATSYSYRYSATAPDISQDTCRTTELWLRLIPAGTFTMGSPTDELGRCDNEIQHQVTLTEDFYIGVFECTQRQWELVMGIQPSWFSNADCYTTRPAEMITYDMIRGTGNKAGAGWPAYGHTVDADSFMGRLQAKTGLFLDLPTEAQWEYACRKRADGSYWGTALNSGKSLTSTSSCPNMAEVGRYYQNGFLGFSASCGTSSGTAKVGSYCPSEMGLYDMHGNVWEWCLDWHESYGSTVSNPQGATSGSCRVRRGSGWRNEVSECRAAYRSNGVPSYSSHNGGLRIACHASCDITYSLSYTLTPSTATWTVNGKNYASGEAASLPAGTYQVTFADVEGYQTPNAQSVTLSENTSKTVAYETASGTDKTYLVIDLSAGADATSYSYRYSATAPDISQDTCRTTELWLRLIPAGTFTMGSPEDEIGRSDDETQHQVTLTEDFYIGVFECTQRQWELVMGTKPSYFNNADYYATRPVDQVSYNMIRGTGNAAGAGWPAYGHTVDADSFMGRLQARTGLVLDLPTEAQWEYACRKRADGSCWSTALNSGKDLTYESECSNMAKVGRYWFNGGSEGSSSCSISHGTAKVGSYQPSEMGLYDMHGNVWEWCLDWHGSYSGNVSDPQGATSGTLRVYHGGSWFDSAHGCRAARRCNDAVPSCNNSFSGFRLACSAPSSSD